MDFNDPKNKAIIKDAVHRLANKNKLIQQKDYEMKKVRVVHIKGNAWEEEKRLIANGETFTVSKTNVTTKFTFPERNTAARIFSSKSFTYKELNLFQEIKKEVKSNIEQKKLIIPEYTSKDIGYYLFSNKVHQVQKSGMEEFTDIDEYDISKAYYMAAYNLGYISEEFFFKCIGLPKTTRLRLIGSIATFKTIFIYRKGKLAEVPEPKQDKELRKAWFHICKYVDVAMRELRRLLGDDFLFYWVDGLYCKNNPRMADYLLFITLKYGFSFEHKKIDRVLVKKDDIKKAILVKAYKKGQNPLKPTSYFLNNSGEVIKKLKKFYIKNFPVRQNTGSLH